VQKKIIKIRAKDKYVPVNWISSYQYVANRTNVYPEYRGSDQWEMTRTFSHTHEFDGLARDCSYTESRPASGVTVHLSENSSSDADIFIKST
jgi:hypothetical protein